MATTEGSVQTVGVIGLGTMGAGIVEVMARGGRTVIGVETTQEAAERGRSILQRSTDKAVQRGKLDEAGQAEILGCITVTQDMADLADVDLVIEAVPETLEIKHSVFSKLDEIVRPDAVLASNTSSLSITQIAAGTKHPERVIGMHFFNPAPILKLVEVITTPLTDGAVVESVQGLATELGKKPVVVGDRAGFVANYLLFGYLNRSMQMLDSGLASREDIDTAVRVGAGFPMGPMTLMDLIGLDVCNDIGEVIYTHSRSAMHAPSAMLQRMVTAGMHGRKSGRGFYTYDKPGGGTVVDDALTPSSVESDAAAKVSAVAVLGSNDLADEIATALGTTNAQVVRPEGDLSVLSGAQVLIDARSLEERLEQLEDHLQAEGAEAEVDDELVVISDEVESAIAANLSQECIIVGVAGDEDGLEGSVAETGALYGRPDRAVHLTIHDETKAGQLAEVATCVATSGETVATVRGLLTAAGLTPIVAKDRPGLVLDNLLYTYLNDAVNMLDAGYASARDIDTAMQYGCGYPAGPLATIDALGADRVVAGLEELGGQGLSEPSPLLLEHLVLGQTFHDEA